jgi:hypothetical protein
MTAIRPFKASPAAVVLSALLILAAVGCAGAAGKKEPAPRRNPMPTLSFGLTDEKFWTDRIAGLKPAMEKAEEEDFRGLLLEGPGSVDLGKRETLHLIGLRRCTHEENFRLRLDKRALLVAVSRATNAVYANAVWEDKSEGEEPAAAPAKFPKGTSVEPIDVEVRERLPGLPWSPDTVSFSIVLFDQRSNTASVRLFHPAVQDPEVAAHLNARLKPGYPLPIWPKPGTAAGHAFEKLIASPALPEATGIVLAAERASVSAKNGKCVVRGAFRLPALPGEMVRARPAPGTEDAEAVTGHPWSDVGDAKAKAVLPITLLLTGDDNAGPWIFRLQVPVYGTAGAAGYEGYFNVNLLALEGFGAPQTYVVRALHGAAESEPVKISLVTKDMLPK